MEWTVIGFTAAFLTMFAFVPQIIKIIKTKSAHDVSLGTLIQLGAGVSLWIVYGVHLKNAVIVVANLVSLLSLVVIVLLFYHYERHSLKHF